MNLYHMLKLWRQLCSKQQTLSKFIQPKKINKFMKLSKQCAPEYQSLICPKKKKGLLKQRISNNFVSLVPKSTATTSTSTTRCKQLLWSKGDACFLAVHFGGLVFLAFLLMRKWQRTKLKKTKKHWNHTTFGGIQDFEGGGGPLPPYQKLRLIFVDLLFFPKERSWCIIGSVIWSLDVKAWRVSSTEVWRMDGWGWWGWETSHLKK